MDEKTPSSWDDLLNQIGVTPTDDAAERRRPAIENTFERPATTAPAPKPKAGDWRALANDLGIEPAPEPPREHEAHAGPGAVEAGFASIEPLESDFEEIIEEEIADVEFAEGEADDSLFDEDSELEADADDSELDADGDDSDLTDQSDLTDEEDEFDDDEGDELPPSTLSGEAARSAFEALFQAGSGTGQPRPAKGQPRPATGQPRSATGQPRPATGQSRPGAGAPRSAARREETGDDIFGDGGSPPRPGRPTRGERSPRARRDDDDRADGPPAADEGAAEAPQEGQRRRRRRRGGRGRDRDRDREGADPAPQSAGTGRRGAAEDDDAPSDELWSELPEGGDAPESAEDEGDERPRRRRSRRGRGGRGRRAAEPEAGEPRESAAARPAGRNGRQPAPLDEDEGDDSAGMASLADDADEDDDSSSGRGAHKSIPSWSEAISVMVDVNMQARKNAPQRPSGQRGGRGRGRGRGGRGGNGDRGGRSRG